MVRRQTLSCCALAQLNCSNVDSIDAIWWEIEQMKREAKEYCYENEEMHGKGQRACFVITTPLEQNLEKNLKILGFKVITKLDRRRGYPQGELKMYLLRW